jgi:hypothetical protein
MSTSRKLPDERPPLEWRRANSEEALKLIQGWLETDESSDDTSDWEQLKKLLDKDRLSGRKLFSNE